MAKFKIEYDREGCIGAVACVAAAEKFFILKDDGKVDLVGGVLNEKSGWYELVVENEQDVKDLKVAEEGCPVKVIKVTKIEE